MSCKVWSTLNATRKDGSDIKLRFQDFSWEQNKNDIMDFLLKHFIREEAFHKAAGMYKSEEALAEYREVFTGYCERNRLHIAVCCLDDDSETIDILGLSFMCEIKNYQLESDLDLSKLSLKTKEMQDFVRLISLTSDIKNKDYQSWYEGRGISVHPDYRGSGIANEFVRLRKEICIQHNVDMTCAWMTSIGTQKAADKYNWKTYYEVPVEELGKEAGLVFDANVPTFKLMYATKD